MYQYFPILTKILRDSEKIQRFQYGRQPRYKQEKELLGNHRSKPNNFDQPLALPVLRKYAYLAMFKTSQLFTIGKHKQLVYIPDII